MKNTASLKGQVPFPFVLEGLVSLHPTIKRMFGFTYVYLDHKLLFSLRDGLKQPGTNGIWIYTTAEHLESLAREFPQLPGRQLWRSGKNCWESSPLGWKTLRNTLSRHVSWCSKVISGWVA